MKLLPVPSPTAVKQKPLNQSFVMELNETPMTPQEVSPEQSERNDAPVGQPSDTTNDTEQIPEQDQQFHVPTTKEGIIEALKEIALLNPEQIMTDNVTRLKAQFYQLRNDELASEREAYLAVEGADPEAFKPAADPAEEDLRTLLSTIKDKKAELRAKIEAEHEANLNRKEAIINELIGMSADTDSVNLHYQRAKELQTEFKTIGEVPAPKAAAIWKAYQDAVERFYDQWKVNKELRDYDFKKNLADKEAIIAEARKLTEAADVIQAYKRLQDLHEQWRETGPVAKEIREEIWNTFREASTAISKRYQNYFEERKAHERENEQAKTLLCEKVESIDFSQANSYAAWEALTKEYLKAQEDWKALGFASRKVNAQLFTRFRNACDKFFESKSTFYKRQKEELSNNLAAKIALCEQAEALKDSTDWKKATDKFVELQKEWKKIGPVGKRMSDNVWHRFQTACDHFFDTKKQVTSDTRKTEQANLKAKQGILEALRALNADDSATPRTEAISAVKELRTQWQGIGHVPFRDKDKLQDAYRQLIGELFDKLDMRENRNRQDRADSNQGTADGDANRIVRERERLARTIEQRRQELNTYKNNLGFLNSKSKSGESHVREIERKSQKLRDDIAQLQEKLKQIDQKL